MKDMGKAKQFRVLFRANMAIGVLASIVAVYFIINAQYPDLASRKAMETLLNITFVGGLLYAVGFWYVCVLSRPVLEKKFSQQPRGE